ncbi:DUF2339 domain-containing protein [Candidatus Peregrinibacteria bacterium]|nr:DUF2339 domain-containing protein [Candidatus Peregrinibacteria bacterium]
MSNYQVYSRKNLMYLIYALSNLSFWVYVILFIILFSSIRKLKVRVSRLEKGEFAQQKFSQGPATATSEGVKGGTQVPTLNESDQQIVSYIKEGIARGVPTPEIINNLTKAGWEQARVANLITGVLSSSEVSIPGSGSSGVLSGTQEKPSTNDSDTSGAFVEWLKVDWPMKLGGLLLIIGFGWFVTYAFMNNWIGPFGRITLGIVAGVLILILGEWRVRSSKTQGTFFIGLGAGVILLTIYAARELYDFFTPITALGAMFLTVSFAALSSVRHDSKSLAFFSLVLGYVAPLLAGSKEFNFVGLFSYLFVITLGVLWVVQVTKWRDLILFSLVILYLYSISVVPSLYRYGYIAKGTVFNTPALFSIAFGILYFITTTISILKNSEERRKDIITAAVNGVFILGWIMVAVSEEWRSLIAAAWALVFAVGAGTIFRITNNREPFLVYGAIAAAFIGTATALELHGASLAIASILEVLAVIFLTAILTGDKTIAARTALLTIIPTILSVPSVLSSAWRYDIFHKDFAVLFLITAMFCILGSYFYSSRTESDKSNGTSQLFVSLLSAGGIFAMILIWLSFGALFTGSTAVTLSLAVYTLAGIAFYARGVTHGSTIIKTAGQLLIGFVVGRLLIVDVWSMEITGRIITFFLIGVLLISTAFFRKKK